DGPVLVLKGVGIHAHLNGGGCNARGRGNSHSRGVAADREVGGAAARIGDGHGLHEYVPIAGVVLCHDVALGYHEPVRLVQPAYWKDHHAAVGNRIEHVVGGTQDAAAGDVFRQQEALADGQIIRVHDV